MDRKRLKDETFNETFNRDADQFWKVAHIPGLIEDLDRQNDAQEYMESLLDYIQILGWVFYS